jgi:hypothetical protein
MRVLIWTKPFLNFGKLQNLGLSRKVKGSEAGVPQDLLRREESKAFKPGEVHTFTITTTKQRHLLTRPFPHLANCNSRRYRPARTTARRASPFPTTAKRRRRRPTRSNNRRRPIICSATRALLAAYVVRDPIVIVIIIVIVFAVMFIIVVVCADVESEIAVSATGCRASAGARRHANAGRASPADASHRLAHRNPIVYLLILLMLLLLLFVVVVVNAWPGVVHMCSQLSTRSPLPPHLTGPQRASSAPSSPMQTRTPPPRNDSPPMFTGAPKPLPQSPSPRNHQSTLLIIIIIIINH